MDNFGVSFAPTQDNAAMGQRNGQLSGVPQAVQVLSLALPRVVGARPVAPQSLLTAQGGQGVDPAASAVLASLMKLLHGISNPQPGAPGSFPGGTAGPNQPGPMPSPSPMPGTPPIGGQPSDPFGGGTMPNIPTPAKPRIITQNPGDPAPGGMGAGNPFRQNPPIPGGRFQR